MTVYCVKIMTHLVLILTVLVTHIQGGKIVPCESEMLRKVMNSCETRGNTLADHRVELTHCFTYAIMAQFFSLCIVYISMNILHRFIEMVY